MGIFGGIYYYFPKITGRYMSETLGKLALLDRRSSAMNLTFFPMHFSGMLGMPRRIYTYDAGQGWDTFNMISTIGTAILIVSTSIFVVNFLKSRRSGAVAPNDPWGARHARVVDSVAAAGLQLRRDPGRDVALSAVGPQAPGAHGAASRIRRPTSMTITDAHAVAGARGGRPEDRGRARHPDAVQHGQARVAALAIVADVQRLLFMHDRQVRPSR